MADSQIVKSTKRTGQVKRSVKSYFEYFQITYIQNFYECCKLIYMQFYNDMNHLEYKYTLLVSACDICNFITGTYYVIIFNNFFSIGTID